MIRVEVITPELEQADAAMAKLLAQPDTEGVGRAHFDALGRFAEPRLRRALAIVGEPTLGQAYLQSITSAETRAGVGSKRRCGDPTARARLRRRSSTLATRRGRSSGAGRRAWWCASSIARRRRGRWWPRSGGAGPSASRRSSASSRCSRGRGSPGWCARTISGGARAPARCFSSRISSTGPRPRRGSRRRRRRRGRGGSSGSSPGRRRRWRCCTTPGSFTGISAGARARRGGG